MYSIYIIFYILYSLPLPTHMQFVLDLCYLSRLWMRTALLCSSHTYRTSSSQLSLQCEKQRISVMAFPYHTTPCHTTPHHTTHHTPHRTTPHHATPHHTTPHHTTHHTTPRHTTPHHTIPHTTPHHTTPHHTAPHHITCTISYCAVCRYLSNSQELFTMEYDAAPQEYHRRMA